MRMRNELSRKPKKYEFKILGNIYLIARLVGDCSIKPILTLSKTSRVQAVLPKHSSVTVCCAFAVIIGSNRFISIGNKCQSNLSIDELISSNASFSRWPSSHAINTTVSATIPFKINVNLDRMSPWSNWNQWEKYKNRGNRTIFLIWKMTEIGLNYFHLNNQHASRNSEKAPCEQRHQYGLKYVRKIMYRSEKVNGWAMIGKIY